MSPQGSQIFTRTGRVFCCAWHQMMHHTAANRQSEQIYIAYIGLAAAAGTVVRSHRPCQHCARVLMARLQSHQWMQTNAGKKARRRTELPFHGADFCRYDVKASSSRSRTRTVKKAEQVLFQLPWSYTLGCVAQWSVMRNSTRDALEQP